MALLIEEPGLASTIQDLGRPGYYNVGIPLGGAMDRMSLETANLLVGNDAGAAAIEATYTAPKFEVTAATTMAVTGAAVTVAVNGTDVAQWESIPLAAGDKVSIGYATAGTRAYLAFGGGIDVPSVLGSRGTYSLGKLGGYHGRPLAAGDTLETGSLDTDDAVSSVNRTLPENLRPTFSKAITVRVMLGLYDHLLTAESVAMLTSTEWKLTPLADRTGLRFSGPTKFEFNEREQPFGAGSDPSNIVDAGYAMGSIQIPGGSQPIVLHRDAVSAGGYAMVATVISTDMNLLAQLTPGSTCVFEPVTLEQALAARAVAALERRKIHAHLTA